MNGRKVGGDEGEIVYRMEEIYRIEGQELEEFGCQAQAFKGINNIFS